MTLKLVAERAGGDVPLPWVRLDTAFPYNPKLLAMVAERDGHRAALVYVCSLAYSGAHGTDGFIPREALPFIHSRLMDAKMLVRHGFWREQPGGWLIHDWKGFQESNKETQERSVRAQAAAQARWKDHIPSSGAERMRRHRKNRDQSETKSVNGADLRIVDNRPRDDACDDAERPGMSDVTMPVTMRCDGARDNAQNGTRPA